jgi:hypothetical protein
VLYKLAFNKEFCIDNIKSLKGEEWKPINSRYYISNYGRVKSYCGYNAILLKYETTNKGYYRVCIDGKKYLLHRLVAKAFIPNNDIKKDCVHHIDENPKNDNFKNLKWVSQKENI